jgi:hypothetical protein
MLKKVKSSEMSTCQHFQICRVFLPNRNLKNDSQVSFSIPAKTEEKKMTDKQTDLT